MKTKTGVLFLVAGTLMFLAGPLMGQNTETIKEKKIVSTTVYEYFIEKGMDEPVVESIETFDNNGNTLEIKEFNSKGEVKLWQKYAYNEEGKVVEALYLNNRGKLESKEKTIYEDGLRIEKLYYNNKDKLVKRKVYEYEFRD